MSCMRATAALKAILYGGGNVQKQAAATLKAVRVTCTTNAYMVGKVPKAKPLSRANDTLCAQAHTVETLTLRRSCPSRPSSTAVFPPEI